MDEDNYLKDEELELALKAIFKRSQVDMDFRALCLSDPDAAFLEVCGKKPPPGKNIRFSNE